MDDCELPTDVIDLVSKEICGDWTRLARKLGVQESCVQGIELDFKTTQERSYQTLLQWKKTSSEDPTWRTLKLALEFIPRNDIIRLIAKNFPILSNDDDAENLLKYNFDLEKKFGGGCLLSFRCHDHKIDICTEEVKLLIYRNNESSENKNYRIEEEKGVLYLHIDKGLKTGYKYTFILNAKTKNGGSVRLGFHDLEPIDDGSCNHMKIEEKIIFLVHNDGTSKSIHFFDKNNLREINSDTRCTLVKKDGYVAEDVDGFRKMTKEYFDEHHDQMRFPPGIYIKDDDLRSFGDKLESISKNIRILTGYNPFKHLKMFGFKDSDLEAIEITSDEVESVSNSVVSINSEESLVIVGLVSKEEQDLKKTIKLSNDLLKAIYILHKSYLSDYAGVIGVIVLPNVEREELTNNRFKFLNLNNALNLKQGGTLFVTENEFKDEGKVKSWLNSLILQIKQMRDAQPTQRQIESTGLDKVAGEMMGFMSLGNLKFPRMNRNVTEKICSAFLNDEQIKAIQDPCKHKYIRGPFGSGKSLVLQEISRNLFDTEAPVTVNYICYDPYSLLEIETEEYFNQIMKENKKQDSGKQLISINIADTAKDAGFQVDKLYNHYGVPQKNIADLLKFIAKASPNSHFFIDEFSEVFVHKNYCRELRTCLQQDLKESTVVFAVQSVSKKQEIHDGKMVEKIERYSLLQSGLKAFLLKKSMRMASNLFELTKLAQDRINTENTFVLKTSVRTQSENISHTQSEASNHDKSEDSNHGKSEDINLAKLEELLPYSENKEGSKKLTTSVQFQAGICGTKISFRDPSIVLLNSDFSFFDILSAKVLSFVFKHLNLGTKAKTTIICNGLEEVRLTKFALTVNKISHTVYTPYLLKRFPTKEEKRQVFEEMKNPGCVLMTDYRGFRGCETEHCLFFISPHTQHIEHVLIEVMSRAITEIDFLALPDGKQNKSKNFAKRCLERVGISFRMLLKKLHLLQSAEISFRQVIMNACMASIKVNIGEKDRNDTVYLSKRGQDVELESLAISDEDQEIWEQLKKDYEVMDDTESFNRTMEEAIERPKMDRILIERQSKTSEESGEELAERMMEEAIERSKLDRMMEEAIERSKLDRTTEEGERTTEEIARMEEESERRRKDWERLVKEIARMLEEKQRELEERKSKTNEESGEELAERVVRPTPRTLLDSLQLSEPSDEEEFERRQEEVKKRKEKKERKR